MNIVLTGLRGSGKTHIGKILAEKMHRPFIDIDEEIKKTTGEKIADFVKNKGWEAFREIENKITTRAAASTDAVIATGGGTVTNEKNTENLKRNGVIVLLICDMKTLRKRLQNDTSRPPLKNKGNFLDEIETIWKERKELYLKIADFTINTGENDPNKTAENIQSLLLSQ